jgi:hypothetical protein
MTPDERKAWEELVAWLSPKVNCGGTFEICRRDGEAILAADFRIKRLEEAVEWACSIESCSKWNISISFPIELRRIAAKEG